MTVRLSEWFAQRPELARRLEELRQERLRAMEKPLGKPVRSFDSTFSAVTVLIEMFRLKPKEKETVACPADQET